MSQATRRTGWKIAVSILVGVLLLGGIAAATAPVWTGFLNAAASTRSGGTGNAAAGVRPALSQPVAKTISYGAAPADGSVEVNPAAPPTLKVRNAVIQDVVLRPSGGGEKVPGTLSANDTVWKAKARLAFNTEYTYTYTVLDSAGMEVTRTQKFHTVKPANEANAWMYPLDGSTVGTGQPIQINFSEPVTNKAAVEKAIKITASSGQKGAFYWYSDTMARYRPPGFWAPRTTVTVDMKLFGVNFGNNMIGNFDRTFSFKTGPARLAVVDNRTKTMTVYIDGRKQRTFPVTLGSKDFPSTTGYHVVMDQQRTARFDAGTIGLKPGDKGYYAPLTVQFASRLSNGGEFVHQALPEAIAALGKANVSHGCVGMSSEGATYFFNTFTTGDVVNVVNTGYGSLAPLDGFGDWNVSWKEWTSQSKD